MGSNLISPTTFMCPTLGGHQLTETLAVEPFQKRDMVSIWASLCRKLHFRYFNSFMIEPNPSMIELSHRPHILGSVMDPSQLRTNPVTDLLVVTNLDFMRTHMDPSMQSAPQVPLYTSPFPCPYPSPNLSPCLYMCICACGQGAKHTSLRRCYTVESSLQNTQDGGDFQLSCCRRIFSQPTHQCETKE